MKVLKFGGSSVAKPERILQVIDILKKNDEEGHQQAAVFSAFGGVTDSLIEMSNLAATGSEAYMSVYDTFHKRHMDVAKSLLYGEILEDTLEKLQANHKVLKNLLNGIFLVRENSKRTMDYVLSFGERNSAFIISRALNHRGLDADFLDARKIITTNKNFGSAKVHKEVTYEKIKNYFSDKSNIQIVTGFIASAVGRLTTTLGRGGSDYTASLLAAGLEADVLEIWTDVSGVLTADPRKVKQAFPLPKMTYAEAMEMSHFGAKVIYPPTIQPVLNKTIPLYIKNTFEPQASGTLVTIPDEDGNNGAPVKGLSSISNVSLLTLQGSGLFGVPGIAARLFSALANADINIILITQGSSEYSITFAVSPSDTKKATKIIEEAFKTEIEAKNINPIKVEENLSVIAVIGEGMRYHHGIAEKLFKSLGKNGINIVAIAQGSSERNISVVVKQEDESKALNAAHDIFFLESTRRIHLFIVGVGLIGKTLIRQIKRQREFLESKHGIEFKVNALASSKKMLFDENGIDLENWEEHLENSPQISNLDLFVEKMKSMNFPYSIFIDNTASAKLPPYYKDILSSSISISTPNKIAASSDFHIYQDLKKTAQKNGSFFMYETNVGAGLPLIWTISDLTRSGDHVQKIEGILSGTLSYIFNQYTQGTKFSEIVQQAKANGFTEPDPRDDLNGADVAKKITILAREAGLSLNLSDVEIKPILPQSCFDAPDIDTFWKELEKNNAYFEQLRDEASAQNKNLRVIASLENNKATIEMKAVESDSPFSSLSGSDNMIVITTRRYNENPLIIRGPGAGAKVTAAGVFAEIINISELLS